MWKKIPADPIRRGANIKGTSSPPMAKIPHHRIKNGQRIQINISRKAYEWPTASWKGAFPWQLASRITRERQIRTTRTDRPTPVSVLQSPSVAEDRREQGPLMRAGRNANWCSHRGEQRAVSSRNVLKSYHSIPKSYFRIFIPRK